MTKNNFTQVVFAEVIRKKEGEYLGLPSGNPSYNRRDKAKNIYVGIALTFL